MSEQICPMVCLHVTKEHNTYHNDGQGCSAVQQTPTLFGLYSALETCGIGKVGQSWVLAAKYICRIQNYGGTLHHLFFCCQM